MVKMIRKQFSFDNFSMKADENSSPGDFVGDASVYGIVDRGADRMVAGAFSESINNWQKNGQLPMMPWFHNMAMPVGEWTKFLDSDIKLETFGTLWVPDNKLKREPIEVAKQVYNLLLSNGPKMLSVGFIPEDTAWVTEDGKEIRDIIKGELLEVSVVPFGMNQESFITQVKNLLFSDDAEQLEEKVVEKALRDVLGFSKKKARGFMARGYKGLQDSGLQNEEQLDEIKALIAACSLAARN